MPTGSQFESATMTIAVIIVNFCRALDTIECLDSLVKITNPPFDIFLVDNGSGKDEAALLSEYASLYQDRITLTVFSENHGFTGAHNRLFDKIIFSERNYKFILLLNNDTVVEAYFLERMLEQIDRAKGIEMVAARMMNYRDRTKIDNLGITFYKCGLASNRKSSSDPLLGPCGGCALYTTDLLRQVYQATGEYFDDQFFCYAEDTDLAWRAVWLGYKAAYADDALVYHKGSISSGGPNSDFVFYHGIRNSLFALVKNFPAGFLLRNIGWIFILHCAIFLQYLVRGKIKLLLQVYRDFLAKTPEMIKKRSRIVNYNNVTKKWINQQVNKKFYDSDHIKSSLNELLAFNKR